MHIIFRKEERGGYTGFFFCLFFVIVFFSFVFVILDVDKL